MSDIVKETGGFITQVWITTDRVLSYSQRKHNNQSPSVYMLIFNRWLFSQEPSESYSWSSGQHEQSARYHKLLTLTVLVTTIDAQWELMGDVGSARYELALLPPCPTIRVLSYSN